MSELSGNNIPDLSQLGNSNDHNKKVNGDAFKPGVLIRSLDDEGAMEPESVRMQSVMTNQGPQIMEQAVLGRKNIVTAEDLVEMMRKMVRGEISNMVYLLRPDMFTIYQEYLSQLEKVND